MLDSISIDKYVTIEKGRIDFLKNFIAITGTSGSGKSLLLSAISTIFGQRIKTKPTAEAKITAVFSHNNATRKRLKELFIDDEHEQIIVKKVFTKIPKIFINDQITTLFALKKVFDNVIIIQNQNNYQKIMNPAFQLDILDNHSKNKEQKNKVAKLYHKYQEKLKFYNERKATINKNREQLYLLEFQLNELKELNIELGEEDKIKEQISSFKNIKQNLSSIEDTLNYFHEVGAIEDHVFKAANFLKKSENNDLQEISSKLQSIGFEISESIEALEVINTQLSTSKDNIENIEQRLFDIQKLSRKYAMTGDQLHKKCLLLEKQVVETKNSNVDITNLQKELNKLYDNYINEAKILSTVRKNSAKIIACDINKQLPDLLINNVKFSINIKDISSTKDNFAHKNGIDEAIFMLANKNSNSSYDSASALNKIASGGESSRILMLLRLIMLKYDTQTQTLIFDEADSGISGAEATAFGEKLKAISKHKQIIVITHSAQIASKAQQHILLTKTFSSGHNITTISDLTKEQRIIEIARMISSSKISKGAKLHANALLEEG